MTDIHPTAIREARQFVADGNIPSRHKEVLLEILTTALRDAEARTGTMAMLRSSEDWQEHEIETITAQLAGQIAHNWQHADELAIRLAATLHRSPDDVRKKASELGFGAGVDYRIAMPLRAAQKSIS